MKSSIKGGSVGTVATKLKEKGSDDDKEDNESKETSFFPLWRKSRVFNHRGEQIAATA